MAELDKNYESYIAKWKPRLPALGDRALALGYMAGEASSQHDVQLENEPGKTGVYVRVDGRGLDAVADPGAISGMIEEWQAEIDALPVGYDPRRFTKNFIEQMIALNRHETPEGTMVLSAAVWLISPNSEAVKMLQAGDHALLCDFTYDDKKRERRLSMELLGES